MTSRADGTERPLVSVLMAVYNAQDTLEEAVQSILAQTFRDFELIIVDDACTDGTSALLHQAAERDRRIVLLNNERNLGLIESLNKALARARGEYIARMDADDVSERTRLARQVAFLSSHPEIGLLGTGYERLYDDGSRTQHQPPVAHTAIRWHLLFDNVWPHPAVVFRAALLGPGEGYGDFRHAEDYELWVRLSGRAQTATLPAALITIRTRGQVGISVMHRTAMDAMMRRICGLELTALVDGVGPLPPDEVDALRRLHTVARATASDLRLVPRMLSLFDKFTRTQGIDEAAVPGVRRAWIRRLWRRALAAGWFRELWRSGFISAVARHDPTGLLPWAGHRTPARPRY